MGHQLRDACSHHCLPPVTAAGLPTAARAQVSHGVRHRWPCPKLSHCPWSQDHSSGASLRTSPCLPRDRGGVHPEESWGAFKGDPVLHCFNEGGRGLGAVLGD